MLRVIVLVATCAIVIIALPIGAAELDDAISALQNSDYATAQSIFHELAEDGDADAQHNLGLMYANGVGVPQNDEEAVSWWRLAADQGYAPSQARLGEAYLLGAGVPLDYGAAVRWHRAAAEQEYPMAHYALGMMYSQGVGLPYDILRAFMWYDLAASKSTGELAVMASQFRDGAASSMTPEQIVEARAMASRCEQSNFQDCD